MRAAKKSREGWQIKKDVNYSWTASTLSQGPQSHEKRSYGPCTTKFEERKKFVCKRVRFCKRRLVARQSGFRASTETLASFYLLL